MKKKLLTVMLSVCLSLSSCTFYNQETGTSIQDESILTSETVSETSTSSTQTTTSIVETSPTTSTTTDIQTESIQTESTVVVPESSLSIIEILPFDGTPCYAVNNNQPYFTNDEITNQSYEYYSDLDSLGRCGVCIACISLDMMPTTEREGIGMVKPSGWHLDKYDFVDGKYLFNRCHLIGYQLTGENANLSNLITGTRYMNIQGMLPFENQTADYIKSTGNHVMYRVTPIFEGDNVQMCVVGIGMDCEEVLVFALEELLAKFLANFQSSFRRDLTGFKALNEVLREDSIQACSSCTDCFKISACLCRIIAAPVCEDQSAAVCLFRVGDIG